MFNINKKSKVTGRGGIKGCEMSKMGARGSILVKALCYKPEGRGFDSQ
jgi:hypothetical protein